MAEDKSYGVSKMWSSLPSEMKKALFEKMEEVGYDEKALDYIDKLYQMGELTQKEADYINEAIKIDDFYNLTKNVSKDYTKSWEEEGFAIGETLELFESEYKKQIEEVNKSNAITDTDRYKEKLKIHDIMAEKTKAPRNRIAHKDWLIEARRAELAKWLDSDNRKHRMGEEAGKTLIREKMLKYRLSHDFDDDYDQYFGLGEYKGKANPYAETSEVRSLIRGESTAITDTEWETTAAVFADEYATTGKTNQYNSAIEDYKKAGLSREEAEAKIAEVRGPYTTGDKAGTFSDTDASISTEELDERAADYEKKRKTEKPHSKREHKKKLTEWATKEREEKGHNDEWFEATVGDENVDRQYRNYLRSEGFNKEADKQDKRFNRKSERQLKEDKLAETKETRRVAKEQQDSAITSNQRRQSKHQKQARKNIATEAIDFGDLNISLGLDTTTDISGNVSPGEAKGSFGMKKEGFSVDTPELDKYTFADNSTNKFVGPMAKGGLTTTPNASADAGMNMAGAADAAGAVGGALTSLVNLGIALTSKDKVPRSPFTTYATDALKKLDETKQFAGRVRSMQQQDLLLQEQGARRSARGSARGIGTFRAQELGIHIAGMGGRRAIDTDYYNRLEGIHGKEADVLLDRDRVRMGDEVRRQETIQKERDAYRSAISEAVSGVGTYAQQQAKMKNKERENKMKMDLGYFIGKYGPREDYEESIFG